MITFFGPLWLSFIYALTAYYWWYKSILSHTHLWWAYLHEIGIILEITTNIRKFWWFWFIPLGMTNIENAHCPSICCVGKRMQKEFSLWPWELSHKSRALEHVERGHSWIIKSINVHTAVTPDTIPVLKDLSKTFKHIWDSGRAPESCKDLFFFFWHFEGGAMPFHSNLFFRQKWCSLLFAQRCCKAAYNSTKNPFSCTNSLSKMHIEGESV